MKQKKDGVRLGNAEKDLPKVNSTGCAFDALRGVVREFLQISHWFAPSTPDSSNSR